MRLIDADALIKNIPNRFIIPRWCLIVIQEEINKQPTIDAEPVRQGRWLKTDKGTAKNINTGEMMRIYSHDCSVCGWHTGNQGGRFNYCPHCGAKMDGGNDE